MNARREVGLRVNHIEVDLINYFAWTFMLNTDYYLVLYSKLANVDTVNKCTVLASRRTCTYLAFGSLTCITRAKSRSNKCNRDIKGYTTNSNATCSFYLHFQKFVYPIFWWQSGKLTIRFKKSASSNCFRCGNGTH